MVGSYKTPKNKARNKLFNEYLCVDFTKLLNFIPIPAQTKECSSRSSKISTIKCINFNH